MATFYWVIGILGIIWEAYSLVFTKKVAHFVIMVKWKKDTIIAASSDETVKAETLTKNDGRFLLFEFLYVVWTIAGIFTDQWMFFLLILILSFIPKDTVLARRVDALITLTILCITYAKHYNLL